jgi:hypothetical protein
MGRFKIRVKIGHKVSKKLGVQKGCRRIIQKCLFSQELAARLFASRKVHLPGWESFGGKLLNKNVFFNNAAVPFLDAQGRRMAFVYNLSMLVIIFLGRSVRPT